ncbi:hypothetical protein AQJ11_40700 [Streptomyces corchorusii]|uniref:Uncharacterized protein n=2 Tax=Streptomyces TaxID=1883 RepID=A0A124HJD5_STRCK|nr:hypothetical protein [Streptomyces corchorusii]KUN16134.1 hypothetical protein AQJ11_40700 [Streptomyces corchorusii]
MALPDGQLDLFLSDVELSLSAYGRDQVVVVWPRGADLLVSSLAHAAAGTPVAGSGRRPPEPALATRLAERFAVRLGAPVTAAWRALAGQPGGGRTPEVVYRTEWDTLLLTVRGALQLGVGPFDVDVHIRLPAGRERTGPLSLRLRTGEAVYAPRGFMCEMSAAAAPTLLLELTLTGTG